MKTEWGFDRFLRIQTLTDPSNGYIRDDFCLFGAEVFVIKRIPIPSILAFGRLKNFQPSKTQNIITPKILLLVADWVNKILD